MHDSYLHSLKMSIVKIILILVIAFSAVSESEHIGSNQSDSLYATEEQLSNYMKKIEDVPSISIIGDFVSLEKNDLVSSENARSSEDIIERCAIFLASRELKIKIPTSEARELLAGSRSKKIRRVILPILLLLKLKAAIVLPIILSIIALVSFKGFGLSLAALAVAGSTALKSILEHAGSKVSYEVVPTPVGHWSRSASVDDGTGATVY